MNQSKLAVTLFVSASLLSSATFAHVVMKDEGAMPTSYNWTGFYAGVNLGAVNHTMNVTDTQATSFNATIQQVSNPRLTGGVQVGYRRQIDWTQASGVYGLEFSANFSDDSFSRQYGSPFANYQFSAQNKLEDFCLLQLMGGIAANRTLLFLAAGLSWTNITGNTTSALGTPNLGSFSVSNKAIGTALGGGIEYAFTNQISVRVKADVITPNSYSTSDTNGNVFQLSNSIVEGTVGVNYKFG